MKKTHEERLQIVRDNHCDDASLVVSLLSLLSDEFFSRSTRNMKEADMRDLGAHLAAHYEQISDLLTIAICILGNYDIEADAAREFKSDYVKIRKEYLKAVYGLTEDTDPAGEPSDR